MQPIKVESLPCDCVGPKTGEGDPKCRRCQGTGSISLEGRPFLQLVAAKTAEIEAAKPEERGAFRITPPPVPSGPARPVVPGKFEHARFTNYRIRHPTQQDALSAAKRWVERVLEGRTPMLALIGPTGVGKSHLLWSIVWQMFEKHQRAVYAKAWNHYLADALRYGTRPEGMPEVPAYVVREQFYRNRIVLIDEIRFTADTQFDSTELVKFAGHAYDNEVSVLITTNANPLSLVMGPESANRFEVLVMSGESMR